MKIFDSDDLGANHIISDQCQSHDCRDKLDEFHYANPNFKVTLFAIPGEMTAELANWCKANSQWVELAVHGIFHSSNYECEKLTYEEFDSYMQFFRPMIDEYFVNGFKAPGWQISDDIYKWLLDNDWWVADQHYNDDRRPKEIPAYIISGTDGQVLHNNNVSDKVLASHHHTWDCMGNGVYEQSDHIKELIKNETDFKFVSEFINENINDQKQEEDISR